MTIKEIITWGVGWGTDNISRLKNQYVGLVFKKCLFAHLLTTLILTACLGKIPVMEAPVSMLYPFGESGPQLDGRMVINRTTSLIRDTSTWSECLRLGGSTSQFSEMAACLLCIPRG